MTAENPPPDEGSIQIEDKVSPEIFKEIGLLIAVAAAAENSLMFEVARIPCAGKPLDLWLCGLVSDLDMNGKIGLLRKIVASIDQFTATDKDRISKACDALESAYRKRNLIAHGMMHFSSPMKHSTSIEIQETRLKERFGAMAPPQKFTAKTIRDCTVKLQKAYQGIQRALSESGVPPLDMRGPAPRPSLILVPPPGFGRR